MKYVILDLEWNQPVSRNQVVTKPFLFRNEIIQIGAVKVDENLNLIDTYDQLVCPKYYTEMNKHVQQVTLLDMETVSKGTPFEKAALEFKKWCGEDFIFLTWGPDDLSVLEDNFLMYDYSIDWIGDEYDAQLIFDDMVTMEDRQFALNYAMFKLEIKPLRCHDALNDALNTLEVLRHLDFKKGIDEYYSYEEDCA